MHRTRVRIVLSLAVFALTFAGFVGLAPAAEAASATIKGRVTLPDGSPAADYVVWIDKSGSGQWDGRTDANGYYESAPLSTSSTWNVHIMVNSHPYGAQIKWDVRAGSTGVNFKLMGPGGERIYGKATDADGQPVKDMRISAFDIGKTGPWTWRATRTDSKGNYELIRLDPSDRFQVFYEGGGTTFASIKAGKDTRLDITVGKGYWIVTDRGVVHGFGEVHDYGEKSYQQKIISAAPTSTGKGLWLLDEFGAVITLGDANYHGDYQKRHAKGLVGKAEMVDIEPTRDGDGYYILDSAGGIHTFGDAAFRGSIPGLRQKGQKIGKADVVALAITRSGNGYWVLDDAGGMFNFGDATFHGSIPGLRQKGQEIGRADVIGMSPTPGGRGYWLVDDAGGMFNFGDATFKGSVPGLRQKGVTVTHTLMRDMHPSFDGDGYFVLGYDGAVYSFGDADDQGDLLSKKAGGPAAAIVLSP